MARSIAVEPLKRYRELQEAHCEMFGADYRTGLDLIFGDFGRRTPVSSSVTRGACGSRRRPDWDGIGLHSHASILLASGDPITDVSRRLGRTSHRRPTPMPPWQRMGHDAEQNTEAGRLEHQEPMLKQIEVIDWSGRRDLNPGPLAPQASALARLRHGPMSWKPHSTAPYFSCGNDVTRSFAAP
jgi:hypothetical protein